jgi:hypothetical protein
MNTTMTSSTKDRPIPDRQPSPAGFAGECWKTGWDLIDTLAQRQPPEDATIHFMDDGTVDFGWYHPVMAPIMCALCGKSCREQGKEPCPNLFPFCG